MDVEKNRVQFLLVHARTCCIFGLCFLNLCDAQAARCRSIPKLWYEDRAGSFVTGMGVENEVCVEVC